MELRLNEDQQLFAETTRRYLAAAVPTAKLRELRESPEGFESAYWAQGAELGWLSMLVEEDHGGGSVSGEGVRDLALVAYEFGRFAAPGPILTTNVVASALNRSGSDEQREETLAGIVGGEVIAAWAWVEPGESDLGAVSLTATPAGDDVVLSGSKVQIEHGAQASVLLVTATGPDGPAQYLVPTDTAGLTITPMHSIDLTRRFARADFADVTIPQSAVVGVPGSATTADVEHQLNTALVIQTAEMVGAMDRAFEITRAWLADRYSFGRPLESYQALKHRFADMKMWLEASHAIVDRAAIALQNDDRATETVSAAKVYVAAHGPTLVQECVQFHGGIGLTFEHDIHLFLRRVTIGSVLYGSAADHSYRITDLLEASLDERQTA